MSTYLLTGTSRGLGLALTSLLSALPSSKVSKIIATSRSSPTPELSSLISSSAGRITHVKIDVSDEKSVKEAVPIVEKILRDGDEDGEVVEDKKSKRGLDVLINNAGILNMTEGGIEKMAELEETFKSNVMSVHYMTRAFLPLLRLGKEKKVVNMTTTLASLNLAETFAPYPSYSYKITKTALNMLTRQYHFSLEKEGFTVVALSPGWIRTDLGGEYADLTIEEGAKVSLERILEVGKESGGKVVNIKVAGMEELGEGRVNRYDGEDMVW